MAEKAGKKNISILLLLSVTAAIFVFMFLCNHFTAKAVDDFGYLYSWANGERISGIKDILESMKIHWQTNNGRSIPHGLVQFYLMLPDAVFDIVNSAVFFLECLLVLYYSFGFDKNKAFLTSVLLFCIFGLIWICQPVFGQVNLWLDGSVNYLHASVIHLLFLLPYYKLTEQKEKQTSLGFKVIFILFAFAAGAYSENGSAASMAMAGILIINSLIKKKKVGVYLIIAEIASLTGYLTLIFTPATMSNKRFDFRNLFASFDVCIMISEDYLILTFIYVMLFVVLLVSKKKEAVYKSLVFFIGAAISLLLLLFVSIKSERRAYLSCIFMLIADLILLRELLTIKKAQNAVYACLGLITALSIVFSVYGFRDILKTDRLIKVNESHIVSCREAGELDVSIPDINPETKYSAIYGLKYIDCYSVTSWPNASMAKFYGVNSIIGIKQD